MRRRQLIRAGLITTGHAAVAGRLGAEEAAVPPTERAGTGAAADDEFPSYDVPRYSNWVPADGHGAESGVFFTRIDWNEITELDDSENVDEAEAVLERVPVLGLPLYGMVISQFALFGIVVYPFSKDVVPDRGEAGVDGVATSSTTWIDNVLVFHGAYAPDVFAERYAEGFEEVDERDGFTVYVEEAESVEPLAYAVSEDALVVGMQPGTDGDSNPEDAVYGALDRGVDELGRLVDTDDGRWLFETTGEAPVAFGVWETEEIVAPLESDDGEEDDGDDTEEEDDAASGNETEGGDGAEDDPIFGDVESLVNNIAFEVDDDGEMRDIEARFSGLYPDGDAPSEADVREHLVGDEARSHDVVVEGPRVHATVTFDEVPEKQSK